MRSILAPPPAPPLAPPLARTLAITALVLLALAVTPAAADEPEPTPPCETDTQYQTLGLAGKSGSVAVQTHPSVGHDIAGTGYDEASVTRYFFRLDVSGSTAVPDAKFGSATFRINWDNRGDFDLYLYDSFGSLLDDSVSFNPIGTSVETVTAFLDHCADLRLDIVNYLAPAPLTSMTYTAQVSGLTP